MDAFEATFEAIFGVGKDLAWYQMSSRAALVFVATWLLLRVAGRRTFAQKTAFDLCIMLLLGAILSRAVVGASPILGTLAAAAVLVFLHRLVCMISARWPAVDRAIGGRPIVVVKDGKEDRRARRRAMLSAAQVPFEALSPQVDEEAAKEALRADGLDARALADALAELKALRVSRRAPGALVLGCDQTLSIGDGEERGEMIDKAVDREDARRILRADLREQLQCRRLGQARETIAVVARRLGHRFHERVPGAAARALPLPAGRRGTTVRTGINGLLGCHASNAAEIGRAHV